MDIFRLRIIVALLWQQLCFRFQKLDPFLEQHNQVVQFCGTRNFEIKVFSKLLLHFLKDRVLSGHLSPSSQ